MLIVDCLNKYFNSIHSPAAVLIFKRQVVFRLHVNPISSPPRFDIPSSFNLPRCFKSVYNLSIGAPCLFRFAELNQLWNLFRMKSKVFVIIWSVINFNPLGILESIALSRQSTHSTQSTGDFFGISTKDFPFSLAEISFFWLIFSEYQQRIFPSLPRFPFFWMIFSEYQQRISPFSASL